MKLRTFTRSINRAEDAQGKKSHYEIWSGAKPGEQDFEEIRDRDLESLFSAEDCAIIRALADESLTIEVTGYRLA